MADSPNYGFHPKPRFSVNHLAEYLCTTTAPQRTSVIRDAKFPRKVTTVAYQQAKPAMVRMLGQNTGDMSVIDDYIARFEAKARRETGYPRDEAVRCKSALEAFKEVISKSRLKKYKFTPGPVDAAMRIEGVQINVRMDVALIEYAKDQSAFAGGCALFLANSAESRKDIDARRKHVAATIHWALEGSGQMEPLPRLCMSFDIFGGRIVKASDSFERFRERVEHSCIEAASRWDGVEPPPGYDGPDWRVH